MKSKSSNDESFKQEHPLQAVVFADSFTNTFRPISYDLPKVLLPLANIPMLEYTLEFLASSGVQEIIVFCSAHAEAIEAYLETSPCAKTVEVKCIFSNSCLSAGDAVRELDRSNVIRSDPFILIAGDVISNMDLRQAINEHKERKAKDSSSIMTLVFKGTSGHRAPPAVGSDLVIAMDNDTSQIILYDDSIKNNEIVLPTAFFKDHPAISYHYDLLDCQIDICSPDVLVQFADNFDYQDIRKDFIHNEVQSEMGHKIHAKIIAQDYAARVHDPRTYNAVFRDIIRRWVYPMVPDNNILGNTSYTYRRNAIYKETDISVARSAAIVGDSIIGRGTSLDADCTVHYSSIGRDCKIGKNVQITGSHIWNNVVIEDNVRICDAIICDNVTIKQGAVIERGCIVSFNTTIGTDFCLCEFKKVTMRPKDDDGFFSEEDDEDTTEDTLTSQVGEDGEGRIFGLDEEEDLEDDDDDDEMDEMTSESLAKKYKQVQATLIGSSLSALKLDEWDTLSSSEGEGSIIDDFEVETPEKRFYRVTHDMVVSGDAQGHALDNIFLEIKSFKFAQNRSFSECIHAIIPAIMVLGNPSAGTTDPMKMLMTLKPKLDAWSTVLKRCIMGPLEEVAVLNAVESFIVQDHYYPAYSAIFRYILQILYDNEIVTEEILIKWAAERQDLKDDSIEKQLIQDPKVQEFIDWLQESEEEDSDEEEE